MAPGVAVSAFRVVEGVIAFEFAVGIVAGDAGERSCAVSKTGGLAEVNRLVADIPCDFEIGLDSGWGGFAVTLAAERVHGLRLHSAGVLNGGGGRGFRVRATRPVAGFAVHAGRRR